MPRRRAGLEALIHVEANGAGWLATDEQPWLRCDVPPSAGRWVRLQYSSGLLDPLTRPVLRLVGQRETRDEMLPAAMLGRATWIGRLPDDLREVWISPTLRPGPFAFRIDGWDTMSSWEALTEFWPHEMVRAGKYAWGRWRGRDRYARLQARRALGGKPLDAYDRWRRERSRPFDPHFDSAHRRAGPLPAFHILADADAAAGLNSALAGQTWPNWTLGAVGRPGEIADSAFVLPLAAGDKLEPHALELLAARIAAETDLDALYADEDRLLGTRRVDPRFKPDWSPLFSKSGYAGAPLAVRGAVYKAGGLDPDTAKVAHVRRVLTSRADPAPLAPPPPTTPRGPALEASVIVPTRDRLDLLEPCVRSLSRVAAGANFELIVLDNGSESADALAFLDQIAGEPNVRVARCLGPFNFSAICNVGARMARHPFLLFLNNDVEALSPDWLGLLLALAAEPAIGAVGAKLLYPDGRLQHGGVVLGLDGFAGHVQRAVGADDPGYLGMLAWPREVAAVTGACLAVEARKFFEVGGFDEVRLPVEYNDIDLCLRLAERGYRSVFEPRARLTHRESASRGSNPFLDGRYAKEHGYFRERWAARLRDDPYFHPALSLDSLEILLG